ncbi:methyltransferase [Sphingosinicella sp. YJ22]|uniref:methyltransferase n=1 Tax=Sphingosinicella sp. YJ22 TaxID=1104780 RepID=UPI00140D3ACC|nr:methyltransferase [Sphingosinicella sp. YJ22]
MAGPGALSEDEAAHLRLLQALEARGYDFVTITPESHRRVLARETMREARNLRGVFGWSLPFAEEVVGPELFALLREGRLLQETAAGWKAKIRVSRIRGRLFIHSAFPTESDESVFLGPDSTRFADFIVDELGRRGGVSRLVDIGTGAGVGGIIAAGVMPDTQVELADINTAALSHARVNAAFAGVEVTTIESDGVEAIEPGFDLAISNPPFIFEEDAPAYRRGGAMHGAELSRDWTLAAARKLAPGGRILLYTGSAIVDGRDELRETLERELPALNCTLEWRELDPDIFGEELEKPAYADVDRIAAIGAVVEKAT